MGGVCIAYAEICVYPWKEILILPSFVISHRRPEEKLFTIFPEFVSLSFELLKPRSRLRRESDCYVNTGTQYTHTHTVIIQPYPIR